MLVTVRGGGVAGGHQLERYRVSRVGHIIWIMCNMWVIMISTPSNPFDRSGHYLIRSTCSSSRVSTRLNDRMIALSLTILGDTVISNHSNWIT